MAKRKTRKTRRLDKGVDDYGSALRFRHNDGLVKEVRERSSTGQPTSFGMRAKGECKLDRYWSRMLISWRQYQAGMIIRRLWKSANMEPHVISSYGDRVTGTDGNWLESCNDAKKALRKAMRSIAGKLQPVAYQVCCDDDWANAGYAHGRALPLLREALGGLADYFQISDVETAA